MTTFNSSELLRELEMDLDASRPEDPIEPLVHELMTHLGENPGRDGLKETPYRVARAFRELTRGYQQDPQQVLRSALFDVTYDEMVIVKDIEVFSLCEHHLLPFYGKLHVAYIPSDKVIGLSKTARMVDIFARRLQIQERLTQQVAESIQEAIETGRRSCDLRSSASLHDDARRRKAAFFDNYKRHARRVPRQPEDPRGVPGARFIGPPSMNGFAA